MTAQKNGVFSAKKRRRTMASYLLMMESSGECGSASCEPSNNCIGVGCLMMTLRETSLTLKSVISHLTSLTRMKPVSNQLYSCY